MAEITPDHLNYIAFFFVLGLMPLALVMLTAFTKISIVLSLLRNALGVQQVPSNLVIAGLALSATLIVMLPVARQITASPEIDGMLRGRMPVTVTAAIEGASGPVRAFLRRHAKPDEREFFFKAVKTQQAEDQGGIDEDDFAVLIPAFVISEVGAAFEIGFLLYLVFAVIDLVVANILMAMGMSQFSPTVVSIPLKLLVFVMGTGLPRLMHGLILSYAS